MKIKSLMSLCEQLDFVAHDALLGCRRRDLENVRVFFGDENSVDVIMFAGRPGWSEVLWQVHFQAEVPEEVISDVIRRVAAPYIGR